MSSEQPLNIEQTNPSTETTVTPVEINEKFLEERLAEAVKNVRQKNFDLAETIFSDLMIQAVKFFKTEQHPHMAKFFFFYGDMLLSKLENNPDVFGEQAQKKELKVEGQLDVPANDDVEKTKTQEGDGQETVKGDDQEIEGDAAAGEEQDQAEEVNAEEEIVQLDTVIFKDENIEIRDETNEKQDNQDVEEQEEQNQETKVEKEQQEQADPIDDLQLAWEHLELSRKLYSQQLSQIQESSDEDKKSKANSITKQIIEISLRLGDLEQWRDNLSEAVKEFANALQLAQSIEDAKLSRNLSSIYFQLGNALLYENKDFCEEEALKNFVESAQIMENCLSQKLLISPQEIPSFKLLKKDDLYIGHLKHSFLDDEESKEIKDTLKNLYEKIEDTLIQRDDRDKFKVYQEKMKEQALHQNQFAQPSNSGAPIRNLGVLSMKRKEPQQDPPQQEVAQLKENQNTTNEVSGGIAATPSENQGTEGGNNSEKKLKLN